MLRLPLLRLSDWCVIAPISAAAKSPWMSRSAVVTAFPHLYAAIDVFVVWL